MNKKISIIMPAYNVEKYINRSIDSILNQDYENIELLIIDDGSTDETAEIANKRIVSDSRAVVLSKQNGGLSDARNYGLVRASGDYIMFIDSDDFLEINSLGSLLKYSTNNSLDVCIFGYYYDIHRGDSVKTEKIITESSKIITKDSKNINISNPGLLGYAWNKIYRRKFLLVNNLMFEKNLSYIEDIVFNEQVYKCAESIGFYSHPIYHYVQYSHATLGKSYHKKIAQYDHRSIQAFCSSMKSLKVSTYNVRSFRIKETINKTRWSIDIVANAATISREEKIRTLHDLFNNISKIPENVGSITDRIFIGLLRNKKFNTLLFFSCMKKRNINRYIKDIIPQSMKNWIIYITSSSDGYKNLSKHDNKIIITLAADYGNLGDIAIAYAQNKFLRDSFPDRKIIVVPISQTYHKLRSLKKKTNKNDIITITGGGNMGDIYKDIEEQRRFVIKKFPGNKIVSFPQTIDFSETNTGKKELLKTQSIYNSHNNLTIFARERKSYDKMKQIFEKNKVILAPDIVLYLDESKREYKRDTDRLILCLRDDKETSSQKIRKHIKDIEKEYTHILSLDTLINANKISPEKGQYELQRLWEHFASSGLVITDRLHGMIFCAITNTPCIALNNSNGKVRGVFNEWIKNNYPIAFADSKNDLSAKRNDVISLRSNKGMAKEHFNTIRDSLI